MYDRRLQGFTIIELLIVIVVIAILATISIVSYNGVQQRAKTSSSLETYNIVLKKAEAVKAITGFYPATLSDFEQNRETSLIGTGVTLSSVALDGSQSPTSLLFSPCSVASPTGIRIRYYDFSAGVSVTKDSGTLSAPCAVISGGPY